MADKGIRPYACRMFLELSALRCQGHYGAIDRPLAQGNRGFRRAVLDTIKEAFGLTELQAATHYNHAFKTVRVTNPELTLGLGRPDDKKGGRRRRAEEPSHEAEDISPAPVLLLPAPAPVLLLAAPVVQTVSVVKASTGQVVATGLTQFDAEAMIDRAARQKKARLIIQ